MSPLLEPVLTHASTEIESVSSIVSKTVLLVTFALCVAPSSVSALVPMRPPLEVQSPAAMPELWASRVAPVAMVMLSILLAAVPTTLLEPVSSSPAATIRRS